MPSLAIIIIGVVMKAEKDWRGVGWPQVAMHSQSFSSDLLYAMYSMTDIAAFVGNRSSNAEYFVGNTLCR